MLQRVLHGTDRLDSRISGISPGLQRGAIVSAAVHLVILLLLLIGLPYARPPEEPQEASIAMVFDGTAESSIHAPAPAAVPAPAPAPTVTPAPQAQQPPKPQPTGAGPATSATPAACTAAAPGDRSAAPHPAASCPTPHAVAGGFDCPASARRAAQPAAGAAAVAHGAPAGAASAHPGAQPAECHHAAESTKNPAPQSTALENTLEKLRSLQRQTLPPKSRYNPQSGGAPNGGGNPQSDDTAALSAAQRGAIGDFVRRCWATDPGMLDLDKMDVLLTVTTDGGGVVRRAIVAPEDAGRVSGNMRLRVFSERAVRAVMDPNCANLPLPPTLLGQIRTFTFQFRP